MATITELERNLEWARITAVRMVQETLAFGLACATPGQALHAAILLKEHGNFNEAGQVFERLAAQWPDNKPLAYEHIQFLHRIDRADEADELLMRSVARGAADHNILRECILRGLIELPGSEAMHGRMLEALLSLVSTNTSPYILGVINYLSSIRASAVLDGLRRFEPQALETTHAQCLRAVHNKTPFCMLRLGDGEGAFLHSAPESPAQDAMFRAHREFFAARWYDDPQLAEDPDFLKVALELRERLPEADIIGLPQADWLAHEMRLRNLRAMVNCLELARLSETIGFARSDRLTTTAVAVDLEYRGMISQLLRESASVSLITCHAELGAKLEHHGRARIGRVMLVPPAHSDLGQTGYRAGGSHFRETFSEVNRMIDEIQPGELVLVGAGFLGKLYALRIKERGGIALDVGSLLDLWMGFVTRPSFVRLKHMQLDENEHSLVGPMGRADGACPCCGGRPWLQE